MLVSRIYRGLDALDLQGARAHDAARQGFLQWTITLDDVALAPEAARDALDQVPSVDQRSPAARAFLDYLDQAAHARLAHNTRRGGRRRNFN